MLQDALLDAVERRSRELVEASKTLVPGAGRRRAAARTGRLYNTAVVIHRGELLGVVPKTFLPNYREFYEKRHFASGATRHRAQIVLAGQHVPFGIDLLFRSTGTVAVTFHVEICEDIWTPIPPSSHAALAGAEVLVNLSASNITIGKAEARRLLCASQSARAIAAYVYSAAGARANRPPTSPGTARPRSSNAATCWPNRQRFAKDSTMSPPTSTSAASARSACATAPSPTTRAARKPRGSRFRTVDFALERRTNAWPLSAPSSAFPTCRPIRPLRDNCYEAYNIQVQGLAKRLKSTGVKNAVIGVSGGLDFDPGPDRRLPGVGPAGPAAREHPGLHPAGLRHLGQDPQATPGG